MKIEFHRTSDIFDALRSEWNTLLKQSATDTLFLTWEFQKTWWAHFGADCELRLMTLRDDVGELIGVAPLYAEREGDGRVALRLIGGVEVADYLDFAVSRERYGDVLNAMFMALCQAQDWNILDLRNVPAASPTRRAFASLAAQYNLAVSERVEEVCPLIPLPLTFDAYLESLDKKQRHEIRRKVRKAYAEADIKWHIVGAAHDLAHEVEQFIELHQRSTANKDDFMTPAMQDYFRGLARATYEADWLELAFIEVNGRRAATYFNFAYNANTLCYNSGYDPQAHAALSPGIVLLTHLIEHSIEHGRKTFDFLQGNEVYKYRMGAQDTPVYQLTITRA